MSHLLADRMFNFQNGNDWKMAVTTLSNLEKAAILLRRLPPASLSKVLEMIGPTYSQRLRDAMELVSQRPDIAELEELVLAEFREMQREIRESLRGSPELERLHDNVATELIAPEVALASPSDDIFDEDTDIVAVLAAMPPKVLATALRRETPRSMALVLRELPTDYTGKVLEQLPAEERQQIFMLLAQKPTVHPAVTQKVMRAVAAVCRTIDAETAGEQEDSRFKTLIGILQMVEREERMRLMEALTEQDEELAAQIDDSLYDYADLLRIQDRSVQKLLTQLELKVVAMALKTAPDDIVDKVMKNLSERVRATLTEEMELLSSVTPAKIEQARRDIANVIRQQDKDGTLQWIEVTQPA